MDFDYKDIRFKYNDYCDAVDSSKRFAIYNNISIYDNPKKENMIIRRNILKWFNFCNEEELLDKINIIISNNDETCNIIKTLIEIKKFFNNENIDIYKLELRINLMYFDNNNRFELFC